MLQAGPTRIGLPFDAQRQITHNGQPAGMLRCQLLLEPTAIDDRASTTVRRRQSLAFTPVSQPAQGNLELRTGGTLHTVVKSASGLQAMDSNGLSDPYIRLEPMKDGATVRTQNKYKTTIKKKTLNPVWHQEFNIALEDADQLSLVCKDWDRFGANTLCGSAVIDLTELPLQDGPFEHSVDLQPQGTVELRFDWAAFDEASGAAQRRKQQLTLTRSQALFLRYDTDNSGLMEFVEFVEVCYDLGKVVGEAEFDAAAKTHKLALTSAEFDEFCVAEFATLEQMTDEQQVSDLLPQLSLQPDPWIYIHPLHSNIAKWP